MNKFVKASFAILSIAAAANSFANTSAITSGTKMEKADSAQSAPSLAYLLDANREPYDEAALGQGFGRCAALAQIERETQPGAQKPFTGKTWSQPTAEEFFADWHYQIAGVAGDQVADAYAHDPAMAASVATYKGLWHTAAGKAQVHADKTACEAWAGTSKAAAASKGADMAYFVALARGNSSTGQCGEGYKSCAPVHPSWEPTGRCSDEGKMCVPVAAGAN